MGARLVLKMFEPTETEEAATLAARLDAVRKHAHATNNAAILALVDGPVHECTCQPCLIMDQYLTSHHHGGH